MLVHQKTARVMICSLAMKAIYVKHALRDVEIMQLNINGTANAREDIICTVPLALLTVAVVKFGMKHRDAVYHQVADLAEENYALVINIKKEAPNFGASFLGYKRFQVVPVGVSSKMIPEAFNSSRMASAFAHSLFFLASIRA